MRQLLFALSALLFLSSAAMAAHGLITLKSAHSVEETTDRLQKALTAKGMTIFARINHTQGAQNVSMSLRPTQLLIFGNPKVGTPLMQCAQSVAIDLPQKALIYEDESGEVWLSYNDPNYLAQRHNIQGCNTVLKKIEGVLKKFANAATVK